MYELKQENVVHKLKRQTIVMLIHGENMYVRRMMLNSMLLLLLNYDDIIPLFLQLFDIP